jgi:hypothetical protein
MLLLVVVLIYTTTTAMTRMLHVTTARVHEKLKSAQRDTANSNRAVRFLVMLL